MAPALCLSVRVVKVESMYVLYVRLVGIGAQARLHQELSMGMGWKGYGGIRGCTRRESPWVAVTSGVNSRVN